MNTNKEIKKLVKQGILTYCKKQKDYILTPKAQKRLEDMNRRRLYNMILETANTNGWVN